MDSIKRFWAGSGDDSVHINNGGNNVENEERGFVADALQASTLSWRTRLQGFAIFFGVGVLFALLGVFSLSVFLNLFVFALCYALANVCALGATLFLMGPLQQLRRMFEPTRAIAAMLMLLFLFLTLMSALVWHKKASTLIFCVMQFLALLWYSLSFVPYAREAVSKFFDSLF